MEEIIQLKKDLVEESPDKFFFEKESKLKGLTDVKPEVFEKMVTDQGPSISDFCAKGYKVVLFFMKSVACPFCRGTMDDIHALYETLYKMNIVVVICYQETKKTYETFIKANPRFEPIYSLYQTPFQKYFNMTYFNLIKEATINTYKWLIPFYNLSTNGSFPALSYTTSVSFKEQSLLAAVFVIHNNKIISEVHKKEMSESFDLARIIIDPDNFGIKVHSSVFECQRIKKPKIDKKDVVHIKNSYKTPGTSCIPTKEQAEFEDGSDFQRNFLLEDVLSNDKYKNYFKMHMTKEYDVENFIFLEEVGLYKALNDENKKKRASEMYEYFFSEGCENELNFSVENKKTLKSNIESGDEKLFDGMIGEIMTNSIKPSFERFLKGELVIDMQRKNHSKRLNLFINRETK